MAHHLGRAKLKSVSPTYGSGKTPFGGVALPVGRHTGSIGWGVLSHRPRRFCSLLPGDPIHHFTLISIQDRALLWYMVFSHVQRTFITVTRRFHLTGYIQLIYSSQILADSCSAPPLRTYYTSFIIHRDKLVYNVPVRFWHSQEKDFAKVTAKAHNRLKNNTRFHGYMLMKYYG